MIWLSTPALMKGYFRRDDLTQAAIHQGWFATGDLGLIDERGYLIIRGRERDEINKGGIKVFPAAIDLVAQESDQVNDVCTFGIEDPLYGENVAIALSLADDSAETIATLHRWLCERLAEHKQPEKWFLLQEIPLTSRGKINRDTVREICEQQQALDLKAILRKHARGDNSK